MLNVGVCQEGSYHYRSGQLFINEDWRKWLCWYILVASRQNSCDHYIWRWNTTRVARTDFLGVGGRNEVRTTAWLCSYKVVCENFMASGSFQKGKPPKSISWSPVCKEILREAWLSTHLCIYGQGHLKWATFWQSKYSWAHCRNSFLDYRIFRRYTEEGCVYALGVELARLAALVFKVQ